MSTALKRSPLVLWILFFMALCPYFIGLGASSIWDSNEAFYVQTPREMIKNNDFINPTLNSHLRFNKPPLSYWIVGAFYKVFGISVTVERSAIALGALILIFTTFWLGKLVFSAKTGLYSAIIITSSPRILMYSRRIFIDIYVLMFMGLSLLFFVLAVDAFKKGNARRRRAALILMYISMGLGIMTKGPVAAILPCLAFIIFLAVARDLRFLKQMMIPFGAGIIALIVLPWYLAVYHQHGWVFIKSFIIDDNVSRYAFSSWGPRRGYLFYLIPLFGDLFPWSVFFIGALVNVTVRYFRKWHSSEKVTLATPISSEPGAGTNSSLLLWLWIAIIIGFYSLSMSKEDIYILPASPALSVIIGAYLSKISRRDFGGGGQGLVIVAGAIYFILGCAVIYIFNPSAIYYLSGSLAIGAIALSSGVVSVCLSLSRRISASIIMLAAGLIAVNMIYIVKIMPDFEKFKPIKPFCDIIKQEARPEAKAGYYRFASPSMMYYLNRPIFECYSQQDIVQIFSGEDEVYCVMTGSDYEQVKGSIPINTYILAQGPIFRVKLKSFYNGIETPQVVLISNRDRKATVE